MVENQGRDASSFGATSSVCSGAARRFVRNGDPLMLWCLLRFHAKKSGTQLRQSSVMLRFQGREAGDKPVQQSVSHFCHNEQQDASELGRR